MIDKQAFGRTGHASSRTLLGAAAFGKVTQQEADATIDLALQRGVNHIDTAASYGDSELRIGSWIQRHGKSFFLATKTGERTAGPALDQIRRSLEKLHVNQVDLIQLHNLVEPEAWQTALGPGGALEAAIAAREEGLVRFIGVTGHGLHAPGQHRRALERFDFDSVLCPFSYILSQNAEYWADVEALLEVCARRQVAVQTIKAIVRAPWGDRAQSGPTWYEPLREQSEIDLAVHWVLGRQQVFLNTVGDIELIPKVLDAAERFSAKPAESAMAQQLQRMEMSNLFVTGWV
ncbi:MAG TPA: aldo/keto reductase [Polyangiaceae bacterium]|jgi:aryl-alcohol dehydrogenase-like predicted oxidoreductase|nr:aldo/keto reductase [Polyangiaceae bacterium]